MPRTWEAHSRLVYGEVLPMTAERESFVVHVLFGIWLAEGLTEADIALRWNQGTHTRPCSSGINRFGVRYDSCGYKQKVLAML